MQIRPISASAQIYLDQINNYISLGEGYEQLRVHLLKQLNQLDSENQDSDETLVPSMMENLRKRLMEDSSEQKSRVIDVIEDLIKYAGQIVDSYLTSHMFCITMQTSITYKLFNPFSKAIFDQNRLRLGSIILYYYQKFQSDPNRYVHVFQAFKQLKERNCIFPAKTYIVLPKVNEFKKKVTKALSQKSSQSDKVGVTFDSIIEFVKDCENQFKNDKFSCANTQFVRALKVKAKTLFDLSQNTYGLELNAKEKDHAKQLYKQIRTMLKEIQKISEEKIKQQKIKNQKIFAEQKIQHMTPKKKQRPVDQQQRRESNKQGQITADLLDVVGQTTVTPKKVGTPSKIKHSSSLLDDDNDDNEFSEFVSEVQQPEIKKVTTSNSKQALTDGFKPLKKPPKFNQNANVVQIDDTLIDTVEPKIHTPKKVIFQQQPQQLIDTVGDTSNFSKKSIHSVGKHSVHSQGSNKGINLIESEGQSGHEGSSKLQTQDILDLQNQQHFSKFQIVNTITSKLMDPNAYNVIPYDIDFSDSSSQSGNRVTFQLNKNAFFEQQNSTPYDRTFLTPKKQSSQHQRTVQHVTRSHQDLQKLSSSANYQQATKQQLMANYNFGVLADTREVKAYEYGNADNINLSRTSMSNVSEEQERKIVLTPQSIKKPRGVASMNQISPQKMNFNSQKKIQKGHEMLEGNDEDEEFEEYQQVQQAYPVQEIKEIKPTQSAKEEDNHQNKILVQKTPQKNTLLSQDESPISNREPLF